ncbi:hypothetical protein MARINOS108_10519 [Marinoscillum sp. 108]|nr:hypothetical protein MARINOS108_10519 [Marinoscillum sp. 108]
MGHCGLGNELIAAVLTDFRNSNVAAHDVSLKGEKMYQYVSDCISLYLYVT